MSIVGYQKFRHLFVAAVYGAWIAVTFLLACCSWLIHGQKLSFNTAHPYYVIWLILSFCILFHILFFLESRHHHAEPGNLITARDREKATNASGLLGGFLIGLPAIIITTLAFVTAFPHFLEALDPRGSHVDLEPHHQESQPITNRDKGFVYLVAVDVSGSAVRTPNDSDLRSVKSFVHLLFEYNSGGGIGYLVRPNDAYAIYAFAGEHQFLAGDSGHPSPFQSTLSRTQLIESFDSHIGDYTKLNARADANTNGIDTSKTDVISILEDLTSKAASIHDQYEHVTAIVFSDFHHDPKTPEAIPEIDNRVRVIMNSARQMNNFQIVGVNMEDKSSYSKGDEDKMSLARDEDLRPLLRTYGEEIWKEMSLEDFKKSSQRERESLLFFNVYREKKNEEPIYLKYQIHPTWRPISSEIRFPDKEAFDHVALDLRTTQDGDGALSKVKIAFGPKDKPFVLGVGVGPPSFKTFARMKSSPEPLEIRLDSVLDVSRSVECDLLVAIPALSEVRSIRLVILPALDEKPMVIFQCSLIFLALSGILLAVRIVVWHFRYYRKHPLSIGEITEEITQPTP